MTTNDDFNTRIRDTLINSGDARESMHSDDIEHDEQPPVANINEFKLDKEMPGFKELMNTLRNQFAPDMRERNIEQLANRILAAYVQSHGVFSIEERVYTQCWEVAIRMYEFKPDNF